MLLASLSGSLTTFIGDHGLYAVFVLMLLDSVLPAASELVMLYAGVARLGRAAGPGRRPLRAPDRLPLLGLRRDATAGVAGQTVGSIIGWAIGLYGGRPLVERHGRWLHLGPENLDRAERWFDRWGDWAVFLGRMTPVVRSFVSIPAGLARMPLGRFTLYSVLGTIPWCFGIAGAGWALGSSWETFHHDFRYVEVLVGVGILALLVWYLRRRRATKMGRRASDPAG